MSTPTVPLDLGTGESTAPARGGGGRGEFAGAGRLFLFVLRRDRVRLVLWVAGIIGLIVVSLASLEGLYTTQEDFERYARTVEGNTALIIQAGPGHGLDDPTLGAVLMNEVGISTLIAVGLMSVFMMVRHTRTEEETERAEMIRALPVGRHAHLGAALAGTALADVLVGVGIIVSLAAYDLPTAGAVAFGLSTVGVGLVFAGIAAIAAQVASGSRAALALGGAAIAVAFVLRAVGDVNDGVLSWLSPIGWGQGIRAFAEERWWVLLFPLLATGGLVAVAYELQSRRDFGAGMMRQRLGPPAAAPALATPLALAVRLQRGAVLGWTVGIGLLAFFYGVVAKEAESIIEDNPEMEEFFAQLGQGSVTDAFLSTSMLMLALMGTGFTLASVLRLRSEELGGRVDQLLATRTPRHAWARSHLAVSVVGTVILMVVTGLAVGVGFGVAAGDWSKLWPLLGAGLAMVPAMLVFAGAALLLHGLSPRWSIAAWGLYAVVLVLGMLGGVLGLPQWVLNLSPFQHVPALPADALEWLPLVALTVVAVLLASGGRVALERRDIA